MALRKYIPSDDAPSLGMKPLRFSKKAHENGQDADAETRVPHDVDIDLREVYFLIMHFLSAGPCHRTYGQFWNELLEHQLLPRRYHAWYSRNGAHSGDENDDGASFPLSYNKLVERYPHVEKDHLVKLLKQLLLTDAASQGLADDNTESSSQGLVGSRVLNAAHVPTLLGTGAFSLLSDDKDKGEDQVKHPPAHMRWPHMSADQVRGLSLREIGGGFPRHHRAPSIRAACYTIAKPATMVQKMQNIKRLRGHRNAVYCAIFDRSGRYVITGSDDRLVKIWSMETAFCLASCRGHEGDITDLAVSSNNTLVASASNDCIIRVWRLPDGLPISVLRGHTGAVTAIAFSPRPGSVYQLLSSSDDGTCRIWDARYSNFSPRLYIPRPLDSLAGKNSGASSSSGPQTHQIFCCAFNANGTVFVTGSSDNLARVWNACKSNMDDSDQPNHEIDVLSGHGNDVNYVQFSGCAVASRLSLSDSSKEENVPKFRNSWFSHDNIVTCSRDGSAMIWVPKSRRSHGKAGRWTRLYQLKIPAPPVPPQPPRGGPRQRILPTPRGVNMIIWSLDNRFVLAAVMDCRICVWNAADGGIVHSLTGHTDSTYVLDVHPFNPRIAMSAGYDGRTIVWDIWEGTPIRIYEISRFKLVDGKFSPDGTSIILSDDVGQLYILNTGQGESQQDAKYDQFFLGDYRPVIQDTYGNVLDQETQLVPYRRNMQDLLCDSGMNPYPEPYQSMYQKRRLGALNMDWKPPSIKLAVGPDFSLDPEYQMLPLADLDVLVEPLPEFVDVMDWEPENEVQSDDNDSEYNVTEEYSSGGEQGSLNSSSSVDPDCSSEGSEIEGKDSFHRSTRKKQKAEIEIMTSSGRRVKRRNLDECVGNTFRSHRTRKSKIGRKTSKAKSSMLKALRPQRAAARNALSLFSKITGTASGGEDGDSSEIDSSESESMQQQSDIQSDESERSLQNAQNRNMKGKEVSLEEDTGAETPQAANNMPNGKEHPSLNGCIDFSELPKLTHMVNGNDNSFEINKGSTPIPTKLQIKFRKISRDSFSQENEGVDLSLDSPAGMRQNPISEVPEYDRTNRFAPVNEHDEFRELDVQIDEGSVASLDDSMGSQSRPKNMYNVVYRRSKLSRDRANSEGDSGIRESISHSITEEHSARYDLNERTDGAHRSHLMGLQAEIDDPVNCIMKLGQELKSEDTNRNLHNGSTSRCQLSGKEWRSSSRMTVGIRSTRSRRPSYHFRDASPVNRRKSHQPAKRSWLMLSMHEEGSRYIPQLGDEVVYLRQGHQEYKEVCKDQNVSKEPGPWKSVKGHIRAVEFCKVEGLEYSTTPAGDGCCKMTLIFVDPTSDVFEKTFKLSLPEVTGFPDFLVERTRFDAAMQRNWTSRDKCKVWWKNEGEEDGSWWDCRVVSVKPKSSEFPDSPWERCTVKYKSDPSEEHHHSPWELFDDDTQWEQPHIDDEIRNKLMSALAKLEQSGKRAQSRLENNYYRTFEALKHDIRVMLSNAEVHFAKNADLAAKMKRLSEWFERTLSSL
ncbi:WD-repeat protein, putative [Ricinus communis]|uniref:WD-repeat protein, putative n=1 Tax=Ricinus communis TaxID=3988 RepID=B9RZN7_RICCO|nr:WD-repeat protein, putative [Ricinus communis]